ncbi:unnamed protein product [Mycena citricolor]|uniref:Uncharacterized protein n=1 Tax=Mycena citricolor TaxID=2018698 RepID=A0AAD2H0N1_9AGAR|nr:unnamed protein product [Mycena citricolor]
MDVYVQITGLDSGKTCRVKALLDSGCSTCCIDTDYVWAEKLDIQELPQPIAACDADNTENISGRITHYVDLRMRIGPHVETHTLIGWLPDALCTSSVRAYFRAFYRVYSRTIRCIVSRLTVLHSVGLKGLLPSRRLWIVSTIARQSDHYCGTGLMSLYQAQGH